MIDDPRGAIDYDETGDGPVIVFVPGSCSTGAAWRPVIASLGGRFRCVTTSLLGYGGSTERRTAANPSIAREAEMVEAVVRRAAGARNAPVHLVGHSFGGLVSLAVAMRDEVELASLTIAEAPAPDVLRTCGEPQLYRAFHDMTDRYFAAHQRGDANAIEAMVDFYGGAGTFASWPPRVRAYAVETTPVNILDWASAYDCVLSRGVLEAVTVPTLVLWGEHSHPAAQRANELLATHIPDAMLTTVTGASHFMIATHAADVARIVARHLADLMAEAA
ncbi:alpha/beta fold hydrolase [Bradyrhizobium prioriisuperbiae]|uniref:alpha/beta fold hydrolase n=1 Tax=Bradyrhizobium prioriisuperbiae TaxID=2854389 RepID=UPI0028EC84E5|nr:alpha/beta fold hydrolase [Bradyrhizobium prioritasuperba]